MLLELEVILLELELIEVLLLAAVDELLVAEDELITLLELEDELGDRLDTLELLLTTAPNVTSTQPWNRS
jgi:hypothetical protein